MEYKVKLNEVSRLQQFVNTCITFGKLELLAKHGKFIVDAKSIMGLMSLDLSNPVVLEVNAQEGVSEAEANELITKLEDTLSSYIVE